VFSAVRPAAAAARDWRQVARNMHNPNSIIDAHSASPTAPDLVAATARSVEDETRNVELNGNRNPECWGYFSQLQIQIKQKSQLNLYREIPRNSNPIKISIRLCTVRYREV